MKITPIKWEEINNDVVVLKIPTGWIFAFDDGRFSSVVRVDDETHDFDFSPDDVMEIKNVLVNNEIENPFYTEGKKDIKNEKR